jgi:hypothetical protein
MMTDQPSRVTAADISNLLSTALTVVTEDMSPAEQLTYFEHTAELLSLIADRLHTQGAHAVAANAWHQTAELAAELAASVGMGEGQ